MISYSQNYEDLFVLDYFKGFKGTLLEIGANDGHTLSNSLLLIENGWKAHLVEPGNVSANLFALHINNPLVKVHNFGIGDCDSVVPFFESGAHVKYGNDRALVSSVDYAETERWRNNGVQFFEHNIQLVSWETFYNSIDFPSPIFDFISIDAESMDFLILKQINLNQVKCQCLCIEYNGNTQLEYDICVYCANFGLKLAVKNSENLLFIK